MLTSWSYGFSNAGDDSSRQRKENSTVIGGKNQEWTSCRMLPHPDCISTAERWSQEVVSSATKQSLMRSVGQGTSIYSLSHCLASVYTGVSQSVTLSDERREGKVGLWQELEVKSVIDTYLLKKVQSCLNLTCNFVFLSISLSCLILLWYKGLNSWQRNSLPFSLTQICLDILFTKVFLIFVKECVCVHVCMHAIVIIIYVYLHVH